ncbi:integrase catalytic domain-containing protein [Methylobacterium tardum]|nr:DDE-type integrase/transposase/recombinase [Methylobacterium tardum]URD35171.1 DDE-type integrase/transposase/recombinase [Methylobacterium tardum]
MPGQAVQIDSTKLPIVVRDYDDGLKYKQVTLTIAIDVATRAILGFYIGLEEGFVAIQETIRMVMLPKTWVSTFSNISNKWDCSLKPAIIFTDQGSDYRCGSLKLLCAQLNIQLIHTPAGAPELKGHVERVIQTVKKAVFNGMPGSLFKSGTRRIDYDAAARAELSMEQVLWFVVKFIADYYMPKWHEGIENTPRDRWNELVDRYDVDLAPDLDHLIRLVSEHCKSKLNKHGLTWRNLHYGANSAALQRLFDAAGENDVQYIVKIDPLDVGRAWFLHPDGHWVLLQCNDPDAIGRTKHEHLVARANVRLRKKTYEQAEMGDINKALADLKAPQLEANQRRFNAKQARQKARVRAERIDPLASVKEGIDYVGELQPEISRVRKRVISSSEKSKVKSLAVKPAHSKGELVQRARVPTPAATRNNFGPRFELSAAGSEADFVVIEIQGGDDVSINEIMQYEVEENVTF